MPYDPIQSQSYGGPKVVKTTWSISPASMCNQKTNGEYLNFVRTDFLISILIWRHVTLQIKLLWLSYEESTGAPADF